MFRNKWKGTTAVVVRSATKILELKSNSNELRLNCVLDATESKASSASDCLVGEAEKPILVANKEENDVESAELSWQNATT